MSLSLLSTDTADSLSSREQTPSLIESTPERPADTTDGTGDRP
ncbi:hypothetical protein ACFPJ5_17935 [Salinirubrum litoreum]|uniref:Uncharacterized protein n=1 Tax=Salinirubrum litoreum TaxID=1126234 RepID=A0ABD5RG78_9EURY